MLLLTLLLLPPAVRALPKKTATHWVRFTLIAGLDNIDDNDDDEGGEGTITVTSSTTGMSIQQRRAWRPPRYVITLQKNRNTQRPERERVAAVGVRKRKSSSSSSSSWLPSGSFFFLLATSFKASTSGTGRARYWVSRLRLNTADGRGDYDVHTYDRVGLPGKKIGRKTAKFAAKLPERLGATPTRRAPAYFDYDESTKRLVRDNATHNYNVNTYDQEGLYDAVPLAEVARLLMRRYQVSAYESVHAIDFILEGRLVRERPADREPVSDGMAASDAMRFTLALRRNRNGYRPRECLGAVSAWRGKAFPTLVRQCV